MPTIPTFDEFVKKQPQQQVPSFDDFVKQQEPAPEPDNAVLRAGGRMATNLNPFPLVEAALSPVQTAKSMFNYTGDALDRMDQAKGFRKIAPAMGAVPIVGPMLEQFAGDVQEGNIPEAIGDAAAMVLPFKAPRIARGATKAVRGALDMIPSAERAGQKFKLVEQTVGRNTPVTPSAPATQTAIRADELRQAGHTAPKVMRDFSKKSMFPGADPLTWRSSRDFQSAAGKLSTSESKAMTGPMGAQVKQLAKALSEQNQAVADQAGVGHLYKEAMTEYRKAMTMKAAGKRTADVAKKVAIASVLGYTGLRFVDAITGE